MKKSKNQNEQQYHFKFGQFIDDDRQHCQTKSELLLSTFSFKKLLLKNFYLKLSLYYFYIFIILSNATCKFQHSSPTTFLWFKFLQVCFFYFLYILCFYHRSLFNTTKRIMNFLLHDESYCTVVDSSTSTKWWRLKVKSLP